MFWQVVVVLFVALCVHGEEDAISEQRVIIYHRKYDHSGPLSQNEQKKTERHKEYADAYPSYEFYYKVNDPKTRDIKGQHETREGDVVTGNYWLIEPTGKKRTVNYEANDNKGFNAEIDYEAALKEENGHENIPIAKNSDSGKNDIRPFNNEEIREDGSEGDKNNENNNLPTRPTIDNNNNNAQSGNQEGEENNAEEEQPVMVQVNANDEPDNQQGQDNNNEQGNQEGEDNNNKPGNQEGENNNNEPANQEEEQNVNEDSNVEEIDTPVSENIIQSSQKVVARVNLQNFNRNKNKNIGHNLNKSHSRNRANNRPANIQHSTVKRYRNQIQISSDINESFHNKPAEININNHPKQYQKLNGHNTKVASKNKKSNRNRQYSVWENSSNDNILVNNNENSVNPQINRTQNKKRKEANNDNNKKNVVRNNNNRDNNFATIDIKNNLKGDHSITTNKGQTYEHQIRIYHPKIISSTPKEAP